MRPMRAFTLLEVMLAALFLGITLMSLLTVVSSSSQGAMDAYYEFLAQSLCREPIEVFRGMGYRFVSTYAQHPLSEFPEGWNPVVSADTAAGSGWRPIEAAQFKRLIEITPADGQGLRAMKVRVVVAPIGGGKIAGWLRRDQIALESLIVEEP